MCMHQIPEQLLRNQLIKMKLKLNLIRLKKFKLKSKTSKIFKPKETTKIITCSCMMMEN